MTVRYRWLDTERVSIAWWRVLTAARRDGIYFYIVDGHRTMGEQQYLYDLYRSGRGNLAAVPSSNAPHIRAGRVDHALDMSPIPPTALMAWLRNRGLSPGLPVPGELWHLEVNGNALRELAEKLGQPPVPRWRRVLPKHLEQRVGTLLDRRRKRAKARRGGKRVGPIMAGIRRSYRKVQAAARRAKNPAVRRELKAALKDRDGRLPN